MSYATIYCLGFGIKNVSSDGDEDFHNGIRKKSFQRSLQPAMEAPIDTFQELPFIWHSRMLETRWEGSLAYRLLLERKKY
jgi:hypothetical protein